jgi:hypothetical protein
MGWVAFLCALIARALVTLLMASNARLKKALEQAFIANHVIGPSSIALYSDVARVPMPTPEQPLPDNVGVDRRCHLWRCRGLSGAPRAATRTALFITAVQLMLRASRSLRLDRIRRTSRELGAHACGLMIVALSLMERF